jgi:hypothetical protein
LGDASKNPKDTLTNPKDTVKNPIDSTGHDTSKTVILSVPEPYRYINISFENVLINRYYYYAQDQNISSNGYDTSSRSSSYYPFAPWGIFLTIDKPLILKPNEVIPLLHGRNSFGGNVGAQFKNVIFDHYEPDSSIRIVLKGTQAENYIDSLSNHYSASILKYGGVNGTYLERTIENLDYYKCTDSTTVEIKLRFK